MLVLFWLVWYLCGPACEMLDFWDPPREEVHDIFFNGGGGVALLAGGFSIALALYLKFRKRYMGRRRATGRIQTPLAQGFFFSAPCDPLLTTSIHSPPAPLRI